MALKNTLHRLRYFCSDAWDEWRHSLAINVMAMTGTKIDGRKAVPGPLL